LAKHFEFAGRTQRNATLARGPEENARFGRYEGVARAFRPADRVEKGPNRDKYQIEIG